jgi:hypothetical protein
MLNDVPGVGYNCQVLFRSFRPEEYSGASYTNTIGASFFVISHTFQLQLKGTAYIK